jgi:hypothetical protein
MVIDQGNDGACSYSHLDTFGVDEFLVLFWWCLVHCYKELVNVGGLLFYVILFLLSAPALPQCTMLLQRLYVFALLEKRVLMVHLFLLPVVHHVATSSGAPTAKNTS